jgi:hypothetical protein
MAKRAARKKKRTARGGSRKNTSSRDRLNRNRGAQPNTKQKAPTGAAPHAQGAQPTEAPHAQVAQPTEKEPEKQVEKPFIVKAPANIIRILGGAVVGGALTFLLGRSVANTHGVEGAVKVASVTILPLIAFMCVIGIAKDGFRRANAVGRMVRTKVIVASVVLLLFLQVLWREIGYQQICLHVFLGGVIGYAIAFLAWVYLAATQHPYLIKRQPAQWVWDYRFGASVLILIGGWIGVIVR